jgi:tetratricopeptide (TPR) repeat protein
VPATPVRVRVNAMTYVISGSLEQDPKELFAYIRAYKAEVYPLRVHGVIDTTMKIDTAPLPLLSEAERWYLEAVKALPHVHCELQARLHPALPLTDPTTCPFCGFFAESLCTMFGWWLAETGRGRDAWMVSEMAQRIAPWNSHSLAHLGSLAHAVGDNLRAISYLEEAIRKDPDNQSAKKALSQLWRGEANKVSGPLHYLSPPERAALIMMPQRERARFRQWSVMSLNWRYYIATAGLLVLHLNFPSTRVLRWLLVPSVIFAMWSAVTSFLDLKVGWTEFKTKSWQQEPGSADVKYEMNRLNKILAASAACFLMAAIGVMVIIVEF